MNHEISYHQKEETDIKPIILDLNSSKNLYFLKRQIKKRNY